MVAKRPNDADVARRGRSSRAPIGLHYAFFTVTICAGLGIGDGDASHTDVYFAAMRDSLADLDFEDTCEAPFHTRVWGSGGLTWGCTLKAAEHARGGSGG